MSEGKSSQEQEELKSRTQIKQEANEITQFGKELSTLGLKNLKKLGLPETLLIAFSDLERMKSNEARKRHFKYIGKTLRLVDIEPLKLALERFNHGQPVVEKQKSIENPLIETWFNKMSQDNSACEEFLEEFPLTNRQQLRQLLRNASKNDASKKKCKAYLQEIIESLFD